MGLGEELTLLAAILVGTVTEGISTLVLVGGRSIPAAMPVSRYNLAEAAEGRDRLLAKVAVRRINLVNIGSLGATMEPRFVVVNLG